MAFTYSMPHLLEFSEKTLCVNSILLSGGSREKLETKMANILKPKLRMHREKSQWPRSPQTDDQGQAISESLLKTYPRQLLYRSSNVGPSTRELTAAQPCLIPTWFYSLSAPLFPQLWTSYSVSRSLILGSTRFAIKFCTPSIHWDAVFPTSLISLGHSLYSTLSSTVSCLVAILALLSMGSSPC